MRKSGDKERRYFGLEFRAEKKATKKMPKGDQSKSMHQTKKNENTAKVIQILLSSPTNLSY